MKTPTVHSLRKQGIKVRVSHMRVYRAVLTFADKNAAQLEFLQRTQPVGYDLQAKGGTTIVTISDGKGNNYIGSSKCHEDDHYVRRQGLNRAVGRAVQGYLANNTL